MLTFLKRSVGGGSLLLRLVTGLSSAPRPRGSTQQFLLSGRDLRSRLAAKASILSNLEPVAMRVED